MSDHTIVTATRAVVGAVGPDGAVRGHRLVELTQLAVDEVARRLELQQQPIDADAFVVDVRVTAFVPAPDLGRPT